MPDDVLQGTNAFLHFCFELKVEFRCVTLSLYLSLWLRCCVALLYCGNFRSVIQITSLNTDNIV